MLETPDGLLTFSCSLDSCGSCDSPRIAYSLVACHPLSPVCEHSEAASPAAVKACPAAVGALPPVEADLAVQDALPALVQAQTGPPLQIFVPCMHSDHLVLQLQNADSISDDARLNCILLADVRDGQSLLGSYQRLLWNDRSRFCFQ